MLRKKTGAICILLTVCYSCIYLSSANGQAQYQVLPEERKPAEMLLNFLNARALDLLQDRKNKLYNIQSRTAYEDYRSRIREKFRNAVGPMWERTPLNPQITGVIRRNGYRIEKIVFESQPKLYVPAIIYIPDNLKGPAPGILYVCGHSSNGFRSGTYQRIPVNLARKGFVVLTFDPISQGERTQYYDERVNASLIGTNTLEHTLIGNQCFLMNMNCAGYRAWDGIRAIDYLVSRPEVNPDKIGVTGRSGGGTMTTYLAALDDRIQVAAPECYITSWETMYTDLNPQDGEQVFNRLTAEQINFGDMLGVFAPKPLLIIATTEDFFPIAGTRKTFKEMQHVYSLFDAAEHVAYAEDEAPHQSTKKNREALYAWLIKWLMDGKGDSADYPVDVLPPHALTVTPTGQVATSYAGETASSINRKRALDLIPHSPSMNSLEEYTSYKKTMRERISRLLYLNESPFNTEEAPAVYYSDTLQWQGYHIEKFAYESEPGILIPSLLFIPEHKDKELPVAVYISTQGKSHEAEPDELLEHIVRNGWMILALDLRGLGETTPDIRAGDRRNEFSMILRGIESAHLGYRAMQIGPPLMTQRILDVKRGIDLLTQHRKVKQDHIVLIGRDRMGLTALYTGVLDERVQGILTDNTLYSYNACVLHPVFKQHFSDFIPGSLPVFDIPDLGALLAPRPFWFIRPVDHLNQNADPDEVTKAFVRVKKAYNIHSAEQNFRCLQWDFTERNDELDIGPNFSEEVVTWLGRFEE